MPLASLLMHAATGAATQLPSLDAKCTGTSKYVSSSCYSARVSTWGQVGRGGWRGAVLGPNNKIYGIPTNATSVLELDPATRKVTTLATLEPPSHPQTALEPRETAVLSPLDESVFSPHRTSTRASQTRASTTIAAPGTL